MQYIYSEFVNNILLFEGFLKSGFLDADDLILAFFYLLALFNRLKLLLLLLLDNFARRLEI